MNLVCRELLIFFTCGGLLGLGEEREGPPRRDGSMWRAADNSKYGTSHISDVPLDLVNNSISGLTSEKFCRITNLRIFGPPALHLLHSSIFRGS